MQKRFARSFEALGEIYEFTETVLDSVAVNQAMRYPVHLALEELFTNMVKYCPDNANDILLEVSADEGRITVSMTDFDVDKFDVTAARDVNPDAPLEGRVPGGLGLYLVQQMVDSLEYEYHDRQSTVTFTKESG